MSRAGMIFTHCGTLHCCFVARKQLLSLVVAGHVVVQSVVVCAQCPEISQLETVCGGVTAS